MLRPLLLGFATLAFAATAFNDLVRRDPARWTKVVADIGLKPN